MTTLLFEHMIRAEAAHRVCRIWRQQVGSEELFVSNQELKRMAITLLSGDGFDVKAVVTSLAEIANVNSVEVIDRSTGDGLCVHKDWP